MEIPAPGIAAVAFLYTHAGVLKMENANPYRPSNRAMIQRSAHSIRRSKVRWALVGFALGAAIPWAYGLYGMYQFNVYAASLPPDTGACGNGALASLALIILVGPMCGMVGAAAGWIASGIRAAL